MLYKILTCIVILFSLNSHASLLITGAGASFPAPVYSKWSEKYYLQHHIKINYQAIGSGGGIKQISLRTLDFAATDKPLSAKELESFKLIQFPVLFGAVVLVANLPGLTSQAINLNNQILKNIFLGKIQNWSDKKIQALNPSIKLPTLPITIVHRADGSGTTYVFTKYLSQISPEWANRVGVGMSVKWPFGFGGKSNDGVALYVKSIPGAIGYLEQNYVEKKNNFSLVRLQNKAGEFILPTKSSVAAAARQFNFKNISAGVINPPGRQAWPLTATSYILIPQAIPDTKHEIYQGLYQFFVWAFKYGQDDVSHLGFVMVPQKIQDEIWLRWKTIQFQQPKTRILGNPR